MALQKQEGYEESTCPNHPGMMLSQCGCIDDSLQPKKKEFHPTHTVTVSHKGETKVYKVEAANADHAFVLGKLAYNKHRKFRPRAWVENIAVEEIRE